MNLNNIDFSDDFTISDILIEEQENSIELILSDELSVMDEEITTEYKRKILNFMSNSSIWYDAAKNHILKDTGDISGLRLTTVYILSEQDVDEIIFGLSFNLNFDREHGRGIQINGETLEIVQYGEAHVAFC